MNELGEQGRDARNTPVELAYAPSSAGKRWRNDRRVLRAIAALLAIIFFTINWQNFATWWKQWQDHLTRAALQAPVAAWTVPANTIIVEPDHDKANALFAAGGYRFSPPIPSAQPYAFRPEPALTAWATAVSPLRMAYTSDQATIFAHRLTSPAGHDRIVTLHYRAWDAGQFDSIVWKPESRFGAPALLAGWTITPRFSLPPDVARSIRIFAGVADPHDSSSFAFDYEVDSVRGTMRGQLMDDDSIRLIPSGGSFTTEYRRANVEQVDAIRLWHPTSSPSTQPN